MANTEEFNDDAELTGLISEPTDVDPVSGNEIPLGATAEGVRDDQTAAISPGEFVIPDYAVRYHGLDFYVESLQKAKQGLEQMEGMGLVGNPDDQTMPDETPLPTMANEEAEMLDTGKPSESMPMDSGEMLDTGEPAEQEFQTGGLVTTPLPQTPQQQVVPTTPLPQPPAIQPIRPVSTQPVPPLQVPTTPLGLDTSQYQQGYYIEASPGLYQLKGPPGISTTMGLITRDRLNPQFKVAPPGTKYEDVFGPQPRGTKTGAGLQPQQSLYESLQGTAAGQPGGYKIESFINDDGNIIYLTTVGGNVQGGTPPGYRKASPEETGQTRRDIPAQAPVVTPRRRPQLPDVGGGGEPDSSAGSAFDASFSSSYRGDESTLGLLSPKRDLEFEDKTTTQAKIDSSYNAHGLKSPGTISAKGLAKKALGAAIPQLGLGMNIFSAIKDHDKQPSIAMHQAANGMHGSMVEGNLSTHSIGSPFGKNITVAYDALNPTRNVSVSEVQAARASRLGVNWTDPTFKEDNYMFNDQGIAVDAGSNPTFSAMFAIDEDGNLVTDGVGGVGFRSGGTNAKGQGVNSDSSISATISVAEVQSMTPQEQAEHAAARNGVSDDGINGKKGFTGVFDGALSIAGKAQRDAISATISANGGKEATIDAYNASLELPNVVPSENDVALRNATAAIEAGNAGAAGGDICVICAELYAQNKISDEVNLFDQAFGAKIEQTDYYALVGYQFWARYVVKLMKKSSLFSSFVYFVTKPWVTEMSSIMSDRKLKGSIVGKIIMKFGIPICRILGKHLEGAVTCQFKKI